MITLYHLAISHYNEKARWALDIKRVPHVRRALVPGLHRFQAPRIAGGRTLPAIVDDDTAARIGESSQILRYLDEHYPDPPLYPADAEGRRRVEELEAFMDEEVGPTIRAFSYGHLIDQPRAMYARWAMDLSKGQRVALRLSLPVVTRALRRIYGLTPQATRLRGDAIRAMCDRVEAWLGESGDGYLHGGRFTAADLAAGCMIGTLARPEGSPWRRAAQLVQEAGVEPPAAFTAFREELDARPVAAWVREIWRRHRLPQDKTRVAGDENTAG